MASGDEMAAPVPGVRNRVLTVGAGVGEVVTSERVPELEIIGHFESCSLASEQSDLKTDLMVVGTRDTLSRVSGRDQAIDSAYRSREKHRGVSFCIDQNRDWFGPGDSGSYPFQSTGGRGSITPGVFGSVKCLECNRSGRAN
ncbi:hypothetical protein OAG32_04640 [Akkermansiaceae bacterium]|nr:hypothetical protein [Akkermansiaceae bacterium]